MIQHLLAARPNLGLLDRLIILVACLNEIRIGSNVDPKNSCLYKYMMDYEGK